VQIDEWPSQWYGVLYVNRPIGVNQRFFWDSWEKQPPKDIAMPANSNFYLLVRPRARMEVKLQVGGFKT
jgi:hypothetical protein